MYLEEAAMNIKQIAFISFFLFSVVISFAVETQALSRYKPLLEQVDESTLVAIGVVVDSRPLLEVSEDWRHTTQLGTIYMIRLEKVLKGKSIANEVLTFEKLPLTTESAVYSVGNRGLMFLKETRIEPGFKTRTKVLKGDEAKLLEHPLHYAFVSGKQGYLYLGVDSELMQEYKVSKKTHHKLLLETDSRMSDEKTKNQRYLKSTEEFIRILTMENEQDREKAWKQAINGEDTVLKESAQIKLRKTPKKNHGTR